MEPVRVKLYGLFRMTKRRYVFQAVLGVALAVILLIGWYVTWPGPHGLGARLKQPPPGVPVSPQLAVLIAIMDNLPWIVLAALAYQAAEAYLVLGLFARKETGQKPGASAKSG